MTNLFFSVELKRLERYVNLQSAFLKVRISFDLRSKTFTSQIVSETS